MATRSPLAPADARAIVKEAYIYGFPMVDHYRVQHAYFVDSDGADYKGPWNRIHHCPRACSPSDRVIPSPEADMPYSLLGADLRTEPLVVTVPAVDANRYYSLQFADMYTHNVACVGSRTTGRGPGRFLLAGPRWRGDRDGAPVDFTKIIRCETDFAFVLFRTQLLAPEDIVSVRRIQAGYGVAPLHRVLGTRPPTPAPPIDFPAPLTTGQERTSLDFFRILNFLLRFCPVHPSEVALRERFAELGIGAGLQFDPQELPPETIEAGIADAWHTHLEVHKAIADGTVATGELFGTRERLRNVYAYRMAAAVTGIYGCPREEATCVSYYANADDEPLDAGGQRYSLRFAAGHLPPVDAFWSLTLYELPSQQLSANPINRYVIDSSMMPRLHRDPDGGLTLYIQHEWPGRVKEPNWLPAPRGPIKVVLRLYAPKREVLDGHWLAPAVDTLVD